MPLASPLQGALPYQVEVTVDGVTLKSATGGSFIGDAFPSTESIAEIRADGVLANAEFSDPGQIVVTTKGGANHVPRLGLLVLPELCLRRHPLHLSHHPTKPSQTGNTFGGSFGGPVVLPHFTTATTRPSSTAPTRAGGIRRKPRSTKWCPAR